MKAKTLKDYLALPWSYTIEQRSDDGVYFYARVNELNCFTDGETMTEAIKNLEEALKAHIEAAIEAGVSLPEPVNPADYKGQISYRTNPATHYRMAKEAKRRNMSINKLIDEAVDRLLAS